MLLMGYYCDNMFAAVSLDSGSLNLSIEVFFNDVVVTIYFCVKLSGGVSIIFKNTVLMPQSWVVRDLGFIFP